MGDGVKAAWVAGGLALAGTVITVSATLWDGSGRDSPRSEPRPTESPAPTSTPAPTPTPTIDVITLAGWAGRADAICASNEPQLNAYTATVESTESLEQAQHALDGFLELATSMIAQLHGLPVPAERAADISRWIGQLDQVIAGTRDMVEALALGDLAEAERVWKNAMAVSDASDVLARSLGARQCTE